ncbi:MAG: TetR family transcriptional regulator [Microbacterium sp.]|uniref:TetR/AcrR family transcriptional regulator n=1 Tax=Microbacterium sp. TaxID=51671 RepID=UPI001D914A5D|nr:TetR/AcrR family transcriptional regulator [Microbacterium sp.]MBW8764657.1 TetR family transcriptional regulator [Microbacterium sp.]
MPSTWRATQKASRRSAYLAAAATLFAARSYAEVTIGDLGEAAGVSGPALYKHFANKEAVLVELLVAVSQRLLGAAQEIVADDIPAAEKLDRLVAFHTDFALQESDTILIQGRDLGLLPPEASRRVRSLQRAYLEQWRAVLTEVRPELDRDECELRLQGVFGLLNSTAFSAGHIGPRARSARILAGMAMSCLMVDARP